MILLFILTSGCDREAAGSPETILPEISSQRHQFVLQAPEHDRYFLGQWSGSLFDGHAYRTISGAGGGLRFSVESPRTLLFTSRLRAEAACNLAIALNRTQLKTLDLAPGPPAEQRILLPRRLLRSGDNILTFTLDRPERIRFYRITIAPPEKPGFPADAQPPLAWLQLPAALDYYLGAHGGKMSLRFTAPIPRIRLLRDDGTGESLEKEWTDRSRIELDMPQSTIAPRRLRFQLDGPPRDIGLVQSQFLRQAGSGANATPGSRPFPQTGAGTGMNVLVILLDSARADRLSCAGYHRATTPNIDRLAGRAWRFENAWAEAAYTLASTATLFSGLAPDQHNAVSNYFGGLNPDITTLAEIMQSSGYHTAAVSAIPYCGRTFRMDQGFVSFIELFQDTPQPPASAFPSQLEQIIQQAQTKQQPFFAYLHVREPHIDFLMPPPYFGMFHRGYSEYPNEEFLKRLKDIYFSRGEYTEKKYTASDLELLNDAYDENLAFADAIVGEMLAMLEKRGLQDKTAVVVLGDHGEGLGEHNQIGHNTVLYPQGLHIPLILAIPGWSDAGAVLSHPVSTSDLTATLIRVFGGKTAAKRKGLFSLRPTPTLISRSIYFHEYHNHWSILEYPFQAIISGHGDALTCRVFNLETDPRAFSPQATPLQTLYYFQRLVNVIRNRREEKLAPMASELKQKEIESLKSLGYL